MRRMGQAAWRAKVENEYALHQQLQPYLTPNHAPYDIALTKALQTTHMSLDDLMKDPALMETTQRLYEEFLQAGARALAHEAPLETQDLEALARGAAQDAIRMALSRHSGPLQDKESNLQEAQRQLESFITLCAEETPDIQRATQAYASFANYTRAAFDTQGNEHSDTRRLATVAQRALRHMTTRGDGVSLSRFAHNLARPNHPAALIGEALTRLRTHHTGLLETIPNQTQREVWLRRAPFHPTPLLESLRVMSRHPEDFPSLEPYEEARWGAEFSDLSKEDVAQAQTLLTQQLLDHYRADTAPSFGQRV